MLYVSNILFVAEWFEVLTLVDGNWADVACGTSKLSSNILVYVCVYFVLKVFVFVFLYSF